MHLAELEGLFVEVLKLCAAAGLVKVGLVSLDGTKVKANASRHKAMSYEYMQKEEERLHKEIAELLAKAKSADEAEDALHGCDKRGDELPAGLARRETRLARIQEAKEALEIQALEASRAEEARRDAKDEERRQSGETPRKRKPVDTAPKPKAQYNFTDPESKIMKVSNKGFDQCGNAQAVANEEQIIIAADVTPQANDKRPQSGSAVRLFRWSSSPKRIFEPPVWRRRSSLSMPTPVTSAKRTFRIWRAKRSMRTFRRSG